MSNDKAMPVPAKKAVKKVKKKVAKKAVKKVNTAAKITPEQKAHFKKMKKLKELDEKMVKRSEEITAKFEKFCKENKLKAVCFYADTKVRMTGSTTSKGMAIYERVGLIELNK